MLQFFVVFLKCTLEKGLGCFQQTQIVALPFKCSSNEMEYELLAFGSKDKDFVKEHGQAAAMFVFLVLLKAARIIRGSSTRLRPSMTQKIHQMRKNMVIPIWRLPWVEWRTRVSCCLIPPCHHLTGRMLVK